jgi:hypothetical protein
MRFKVLQTGFKVCFALKIEWISKSFELPQMGFKIPFALKIACAFKSFDEF